MRAEVAVLMATSMRKGGHRCPKRLKAIFIDERVPLEKRSQIPLIISKNDIIWACGVKRSDLAKVSSRTKQILEIEYKK